jgi:hypothetical protein
VPVSESETASQQCRSVRTVFAVVSARVRGCHDLSEARPSNRGSPVQRGGGQLIFWERMKPTTRRGRLEAQRAQWRARKQLQRQRERHAVGPPVRDLVGNAGVVGQPSAVALAVTAGGDGAAAISHAGTRAMTAAAGQPSAVALSASPDRDAAAAGTVAALQLVAIRSDRSGTVLKIPDRPARVRSKRRREGEPQAEHLRPIGRRRRRVLSAPVRASASACSRKRLRRQCVTAQVDSDQDDLPVSRRMLPAPFASNLLQPLLLAVRSNAVKEVWGTRTTAHLYVRQAGKLLPSGGARIADEFLDGTGAYATAWDLVLEHMTTHNAASKAARRAFRARYAAFPIGSLGPRPIGAFLNLYEAGQARGMQAHKDCSAGDIEDVSCLPLHRRGLHFLITGFDVAESVSSAVLRGRPRRMGG